MFNMNLTLLQAPNRLELEQRFVGILSHLQIFYLQKNNN